MQSMHRGRNRVNGIFDLDWNSFAWIEMFVFTLELHKKSVPEIVIRDESVQVWCGAEKVTGQNLNQR